MIVETKVWMDTQTHLLARASVSPRDHDINDPDDGPLKVDIISVKLNGQMTIVKNEMPYYWRLTIMEQCRTEFLTKQKY